LLVGKVKENLAPMPLELFSDLILPPWASIILEGKLCEGCEGCKASIEEAYQFGERKSCNSRVEIDGHTHCQKPSQFSSDSSRVDDLVPFIRQIVRIRVVAGQKAASV